MAAVGAFKYMIDILSGNESPPVEGTGTSPAMTTINQFADDLNKKSKEAWYKVGASLEGINNNYKMRSGGGTIFSKNFKDEMRLAQIPATGAEEKLGQLFEINFERFGLDFIIDQNLHNRDIQLAKQTLGDLHDKSHAATELESIAYTTDYTKGTFINSYKYLDKPENVPHTEELNLQHQKYENMVKNSNFVQKILDFVKRNPDKFNVATLSKAFRDETDFMNAVNLRWNDTNITKSILEGDPVGTYKNMFGEGVTTTEQGIEKGTQIIGDTVFGPENNPITGFWNLFHDLWKNAGNYAEYAIIVVVVFALLWVAGEIKTIVK